KWDARPKYPLFEHRLHRQTVRVRVRLLHRSFFHLSLSTAANAAWWDGVGIAVLSLNFLHPNITTSITRHLQIPPGRHRHRPHFRSVRQAGTLELLCKEPPVEGIQPLPDYLFFIHTAKRLLCQAEDLP